MHFHLPKPLHGWREFVGEVGIIVIGVLIALAAQQIVETIHERTEVDQLRQSLRAELADSRARWENMRSADRCAVRRLDALDHWLATAPPNATLQRAYPLFLWSMHSSAWEIARSNPAISELPLRERLTYASLYAAIDNFRGYFDIQRANVVQLSGLFATANQPENRRQIPLLLYKVRADLRLRQGNYPYFFDRFDELRIGSDRSELTVSVDSNRLCGPLGG
ncbi:MAG TPA: hypothetical protein VE221_05605 [Sphingomicrobium sp.]|nr:hypothetical protein [Sphingomicrobium sp.]